MDHPDLTQELSPHTRLARQQDWARFSRWCAQQEPSPRAATPATISGFVADLLTSQAPTSVRCHLSSLSAKFAELAIDLPVHTGEVTTMLRQSTLAAGRPSPTTHPITRDLNPHHQTTQGSTP